MNDRNEQRLAAWRERYHARFGNWPSGDPLSVRRHRRFVGIEKAQHAAQRLAIDLWWA